MTLFKQEPWYLQEAMSIYVNTPAEAWYLVLFGECFSELP